MKKQKYKSKIQMQIMGAGKTNIMLHTIELHRKKSKKYNDYMIMCNRIEILNKILFKKKENKYVIDKKKVKELKNNGIINLEKYNIIDYVNNKKIQKRKKKANNIIIINNQYINNDENEEKYKKIINKKIKICLLDECHCVSGNETYKLLKRMKEEYKISIIGFSATPLRNIKESDKKLREIFSKENDEEKRLNIISCYDLIDGIKDEIILPPKYYNIELNDVYGKKDEKIEKQEYIKSKNKMIIRTLKSVMKELPYRKIITWSRTINNMKRNYKLLEKCLNLKIYCTSVDDKQLEKENYNVNIEEFYKKKRNCILNCVNRCREGSDIKNVDCGIYMDGVRKRSTLVSMQTSGRIMRPDKEGKKKYAYIIDTYINEKKESKEKICIDKIIKYYEQIAGLTLDQELEEYYEKTRMILENTIYDKINNKLIIKIDENDEHNIEYIMKYSTSEVNLDYIKKMVNKKILNKYYKEQIERIKNEYEKKVERNKELKIKNKYEYKKNINKYNLIKEPEKVYSTIWTNWYRYLGIDINEKKYPKTAEELERIINEMKKEGIIRNKKEYIEKSEEYNLPSMPNEIYNKKVNLEKIYSIKDRRNV
mgnify:CR=1 FL=1